MKFSRAFIVLAAFFCLPKAACASCISIQIVQYNDAADSILAMTHVFEGIVMDNFFESGNVVTNSPATMEHGNEVLDKAFMDAAGGDVGYLVSITLRYDTASSKNPSGILLSNISCVDWNVYKVSGRLEIASGTAFPEKSKMSNNEDGIKKFAEEIARDISAQIR